MKLATTLFALAVLFTTSASAQDFCSNLPGILKDIKFTESFESIIGKQISQTSRLYDDGQLVTTIYESTQDLIPGNTGIIIHKDYPGVIDFWTYQVTSSIVYDKNAQMESGKYWSDIVKKCLKDEEGWTYTETERKYDSDEKMYIWNASKPLDTHFGFKVKNVTVYVFEEKEDFKPTGRYGVRIEVG